MSPIITWTISEIGSSSGGSLLAVVIYPTCPSGLGAPWRRLGDLYSEVSLSAVASFPLSNVVFLFSAHLLMDPDCECIASNPILDAFLDFIHLIFASFGSVPMIFMKVAPPTFVTFMRWGLQWRG